MKTLRRKTKENSLLREIESCQSSEKSTDDESPYLKRVRASLEDVRAGRVMKFDSGEDLLKAIDAEK
jgi:hypothetical protein